MDPPPSGQSQLQDEVHSRSLDDPTRFWSQHAERLSWDQKPSAVIHTAHKTLNSGASHPTWDWFPGGRISTCYNCVDRHIKAGRGDQVALYYDSPVTSSKETFTYSRLLIEVETLAGALREKGVCKGDVVMLYMPMIPSTVIGMLAVNRLGAIHSVVFGGFAPHALAQRINACKPKVLLTASCGIIGDRAPIAYQPLVEEALSLSSHTLQHIVVWQREQLRWTKQSFWSRLVCWARWLFGHRTVQTTQVMWQELVGRAMVKNIKAGCVSVKSEDPVYILHTSGTTGNPKGVLRAAGGHAVGLHFSLRYIFNVGPGDVMFTASDVGWVVGHSYILYAPLLAGASTILYEGKPVGTPDASAFWRVIEEYKVSTMFTAPTALRAIRLQDPRGDLFSQVGRRGGLRSLRALFLAGERSEPTLVSTYQKLLTEHGAPACHVIDNWWSTETGSPITSYALMQHAGLDHRSDGFCDVASLTIKPGSAGKPMPGFDVRVVDDRGDELERGSMGNIVLGLPLGPTAFNTLWEEEEAFYKSYLKRFDGRFLDTGDAGWIDKDGYVHVMSRHDDVLNVSAHRLSSGAIEQAVLSHALVAEACVVGIPDALKGQLPFAFITLSSADTSSSVIPQAKLASEIQALVRGQVGAIAALGGIIQGKSMIPKTRSGKTLRRVLRELVENGVHGEFGREVAVPSTVEDAAVVEVAREKVMEYFKVSGVKHKALDDEDAVRLRFKLLESK